MEKTLNPRNISALSFNVKIADQVDQISAPLSHYFGITHFGYVRLYKNGTMLRIANNHNWTRTYFENAFYNDLDLYGMRDVPMNESRLLFLTGEPQSDHYKLLSKEYNIWNSLVIYEKFEDYCNVWFFGSTPNNTEVIDFYMNKVDTLKKFTKYFGDKFSEVLNTHDPEKLIVSNIKIMDNRFCEKEKVKNFFDTLNIKSYQLGNQLSISKKEFESLIYLVQGKTIKEIARLLNVAPKTIEFHIGNIKKKIKLHKKSQVIDFFLENRDFTSLLPDNLQNYSSLDLE